MISPSLRCQVTQHIFEIAINQNNIFRDEKDIIEFLITKIEPNLRLPEDIIFSLGDK